MFTCCHPSLSVESQVALTLRTLGGLTTEQIARAFLVPPATIGQRIVRGKRKISSAGIPFSAPGPDALDERLPAVLLVVYLIFNAGFYGSARDDRSLCDEAIRLARLLDQVMPTEAEVGGLLALLLLHDARRSGRFAATGELIPLEEQDRAGWDRNQIAEASALLDRALRSAGRGPYLVQAMIARCHAQAARASDTDWGQILALYGLLHDLTPSAIVALNRAAARGMVSGPQAALDEIDHAAWRPALESYLYLHATRAELLRRAGRPAEARAAYRRALQLDPGEAERRFLERRLRECG